MFHRVSATREIGDYENKCINHENYQPGTDILQVSFAEGKAVDSAKFKSGKLYLHTSLTSGVLFIALGDNLRDQLLMDTVAELPVETHSFQSRIYYVRRCSDPSATGNRQRCDGTDDEIPTLVRTIISGNKARTEPVVEYIDSMNTRFGVDLSIPADYSIDQYMNAEEITDWGRVLSVELFLLVRSQSRSRNKNTKKSFNEGNLVITRNDDFHRKSFVETVFIRNVKIQE